MIAVGRAPITDSARILLCTAELRHGACLSECETRTKRRGRIYCDLVFIAVLCHMNAIALIWTECEENRVYATERELDRIRIGILALILRIASSRRIFVMHASLGSSLHTLAAYGALFRDRHFFGAYRVRKFSDRKLTIL